MRAKRNRETERKRDPIEEKISQPEAKYATKREEEEE